MRIIAAVACIGSLAWPIGSIDPLRLTRGTPASNQIVTERPAQIRLWFNQKPNVTLTVVRVSGPAPTTNVVAEVAASPTDDSLSVSAWLPSTLVPGQYQVEWETVSPDGYKARGRYRFIYQAKT